MLWCCFQPSRLFRNLILNQSTIQAGWANRLCRSFTLPAVLVSLAIPSLFWPSFRLLRSLWNPGNFSLFWNNSSREVVAEVLFLEWKTNQRRIHIAGSFFVATLNRNRERNIIQIHVGGVCSNLLASRWLERGRYRRRCNYNDCLICPGLVEIDNLTLVPLLLPSCEADSFELVVVYWRYALY